MISKHFVNSDVRLCISETNALSLQKLSKRFAWDPTADPRVCKTLGSLGPASSTRAHDGWKLVSLELF